MMSVRLRHLFPIVGLLALAACRASDPHADNRSIIDGNVFGDLQSRPERQNAGFGDLTGAARGRGGAQTLSQGYPLEGRSALPAGLSVAAPASNGNDGSYTLNFENADVKDVIRAVLHDALNLNYTVSGAVAGPVTISSSSPVGRAELLATLERVLDELGFSLTRDGDTYRISASGVRGGVVDAEGRTRFGYGVSVVPLRFVKASTMMELLAGFVAENDSLKIDASQNTIFVRGSGAERESAVRAILSFDDDWMSGQSVSVFTLSEARPEAVLPELERIFGSDGQNGVIQFRAVPRLRGILAISKNPKLMARAAGYVRRLDQENPEAGEGVFVYKPRHRSAQELAKVMAGLFGGAGGGSAASSLSQPGRGSPAGASDDAGAPGDATPTGTSGGGTDANLRVAAAFDNPAAPDSGFGAGAAPGVLDLTTQGGGGGGGSSGVRISADAANNSVVVYSDGDSYRKILAAMRQLDSVPTQVAVNVTIAEVQLNDELRYGVQYYVNTHDVGVTNTSGTVSLKDAASSVLQSQIPGFSFLVGSRSSPDVIISALSAISDVEILSQPSLVVVENQTATLQVGDEVPVTTRQAQNVEDGLAPIVNQIEFRDTGIILNVTPRVSQNDAVTMQVEQEISAVVSASNTLTPTISKRRVASEISVQNGQTVVLAGLISAQGRKGDSGVPGARRVPILGKLLSNTEKVNDRTELVILIRPTVIRSSQDAASVAAELKAQMWGMGMRQAPLK